MKSNDMKAIIVVPTIRDVTFLEDWREEFEPHKIIICEDRPNKSVKLPKGFNIDHYSWNEIDTELGLHRGSFRAITLPSAASATGRPGRSGRT